MSNAHTHTHTHTHTHRYQKALTAEQERLAHLAHVDADVDEESLNMMHGADVETFVPDGFDEVNAQVSRCQRP
jgi:hypothetical protein